MRLALVQWDVKYGDLEANLARLEGLLPRLADDGVDLAIFPEAYLTGYCAGTEDEARRISIPVAGAEHWVWDRLGAAIERHGVGIVVGYGGLRDDQFVNAATLWLPGGTPHTYCKTHLPFLGMDRFASPGTDLPVFDTPWGRIGILICYDLRIPEAARVLALAGADLIVIPTNWPGTSQAADSYTVVRSSENKVFLAACDRVGSEHGFTFIGLSGIYGPDGRMIMKAGAAEDILVADLDLTEARNKDNVYMPGEYELHLWACRQPALYERIVDGQGPKT